MGVVAFGVTALFTNLGHLNRKSEIKDATLIFQRNLEQLIVQGQLPWIKTATHSSNPIFQCIGLDCLNFFKTVHGANPQKVKVMMGDGTLYYDSTTTGSTYGFTRGGYVCTSFDAVNGNINCPLHATVKVKPLTNAANTQCLQPDGVTPIPGCQCPWWVFNVKFSEKTAVTDTHYTANPSGFDAVFMRCSYGIGTCAPCLSGYPTPTPTPSAVYAPATPANCPVPNGYSGGSTSVGAGTCGCAADGGTCTWMVDGSPCCVCLDPNGGNASYASCVANNCLLRAAYDACRANLLQCWADKLAGRYLGNCPTACFIPIYSDCSRFPHN